MACSRRTANAVITRNTVIKIFHMQYESEHGQCHKMYVCNVPKVRAYCSASDHLIRKLFSGVGRDIHWFEEYLKIIEIDDYFFE